MTDIIYQLSQYQDNKSSFVLCIVIDANGSTPRKAGSKMIVHADGSIAGTIGGGSVEMQANVEALNILRTGKPKVVKYQLEKDLGMQCGGNMTIYFEPFFPPAQLIIFGAGHIGRELGFYAATLGFHITYVDNRPDIFTEFNTFEATCLTGEYLEVAHSLPLNENSFVVIATSSHIYDEAILGHIGGHKLKYLGMIGSRRKVAEVSKRLVEQKLLTPEQIETIDMPMGIAIHAETPREIAISIVARLVEVRNSPLTSEK